MSKQEANYHEFKELPANWSRAVWGEKSPVNSDRKLLNEADPYKWSGDGDPPKIGEKVHVYMNQLGEGKVISYFAEYGWLGVLVQCKKNPEWRKKQLNGKNPPGHIFGKELEPFSPKAEV